VYEFDGGAALDEVFGLIRDGTLEVYNEFSLQHEVGYLLRTRFPELTVEFERPAHHFGAPRGLSKKEIDIVVAVRDDPGRRWAIELKYPRNGQVPEQMFSFCKDIQFLEELCGHAGFAGGWFAALVDSPLFYSPTLPTSGIYAHFRAGRPIHGTIQKPTGKLTGKHGEVLDVRGSYVVEWRDCGQGRRWARSGRSRMGSASN
jgi:hypothetical protein